LAFTVEPREIVGPADCVICNEYLRHGKGIGLALEHLGLLRSAEGDVVFHEFDTFRVEQALRAIAVAAVELGVDFDFRLTHGNSFDRSEPALERDGRANIYHLPRRAARPCAAMQAPQARACFVQIAHW